jgi:hypothetical protein
MEFCLFYTPRPRGYCPLAGGELKTTAEHRKRSDRRITHGLNPPAGSRRHLKFSSFSALKTRFFKKSMNFQKKPIFCLTLFVWADNMHSIGYVCRLVECDEEKGKKVSCAHERFVEYTSFQLP